MAITHRKLAAYTTAANVYSALVGPMVLHKDVGHLNGTADTLVNGKITFEAMASPNTN